MASTSSASVKAIKSDAQQKRKAEFREEEKRSPSQKLPQASNEDLAAAELVRALAVAEARQHEAEAACDRATAEWERLQDEGKVLASG
jgi:translation initiation factor IF-2